MRAVIKLDIQLFGGRGSGGGAGGGGGAGKISQGGLKELTGSDAQVNWANDIRSAVVNRYNRLAEATPEELAKGFDYTADMNSMKSVAVMKSSDKYKAMDNLDDRISTAREKIIGDSGPKDPNYAAKRAKAAAAARDIVLRDAKKAIEATTDAKSWIDWKKS